MSATLTQEQRTFLDARRYAVLAGLTRTGAPHQTVMWYLVEDDDVVMSTTAQRKKSEYFAHDPRASLMVYDAQAPNHFVRLSGLIRVISDREIAQRDLLRLTQRYLTDPTDLARRKARYAHEERVSLRLRIRRVYEEILPVNR